MDKNIILKSKEKTKKLAEELALTWFSDVKYDGDNSPPQVLALMGDLGSGKTTFSQYFLQALGVSQTITSPTFVIMKEYFTMLHNIPKKIYHLDCYRLTEEKDLESINFYNLLKEKDNLFIIEWADKIKNSLPKNTLFLSFSHRTNSSHRLINIKK